MKLKRALRLGFAVALTLALLCAPALAKTLSPGTDFYYLDNANVLSEALEGEIFFSNKLLYDACGSQIVVVTLDSTGREAIDDYAYDLYNDWGIGDASKNNGFLLVLAIGDDDYYALPGYGLDSRFSAGTIKDYYDKYLESDFAAKNYEAGVRKFFEAVFERIADAYNANVAVADGIAEYKAYIAQSDAAEGFGGYGGTRRSGAVNGDYRGYEGESGSGFGMGLIFVIVLIIVLVLVMSKGRRARRRARVVPPPPPAPPVVIGYRPTRTVYHTPPPSPPRKTSGWASGWTSGGGGHASFGGTSRSSFGSSSSSRSSSGSSSSRSSFGGGGRSSSGFGGSHGGGGGSRGGGAGRGRH